MSQHLRTPDAELLLSWHANTKATSAAWILPWLLLLLLFRLVKVIELCRVKQVVVIRWSGSQHQRRGNNMA
jgi:hypothetical protein